jgi:hypothetical protein
MIRMCAIGLAVVALAGCGGADAVETTGSEAAAIAAAEVAYADAKAAGTDLSVGPCIANPLPAPLADWVADIAHDPRTDVDNDPANQCSAFRDGVAHHFVELDPDGNLIGAQ